MPYRSIYVPPEVAFTIDGTPVYRTYKDDDADNPSSYWFTLSEDTDCDAFDIRELPLPPDYDGPARPDYLCKPADWPGDYRSWTESDAYLALSEQWDAYRDDEGRRHEAALRHALRNRTHPFANIPPSQSSPCSWA